MRVSFQLMVRTIMMRIAVVRNTASTVMTIPLPKAMRTVDIVGGVGHKVPVSEVKNSGDRSCRCPKSILRRLY